jgi:hypothetical protein
MKLRALTKQRRTVLQFDRVLDAQPAGVLLLEVNVRVALEPELANMIYPRLKLARTLLRDRV